MSVSTEKHILRTVVSVFDAYSAVLFLPEEEDETCFLSSAYSLGHKIDRSAQIAPGQGLVGWVVRNHQMLYVENFDHYQSKLGYYLDREEEVIKSFMGCPLSCGGVLCLDSKRQYAFSEKDGAILQLFADLLAHLHAEENQQDFLAAIPRYFTDLGILGELQQRCKRWSEYLQEFLRILTESTRFEYGAFASVENPEESYRVEVETKPLLLDRKRAAILSMNSGIVGWVFKEGLPVEFDGQENRSCPEIFGNMPEDVEFRAFWCLPIPVNKVTRAVLCLANTEPVAIDVSMRSFVHLAVGQMSSYLENMYLRERLRILMPKVQLQNSGSPLSR